MYEFVLPWPPSVNGYYTVSRGRKVLSHRGRTYRDLACDRIAGLVASPKPLTCRCSLQLYFQYPDRRRRDVSNHVKAVEDCLVRSGLLEDDKLNVSLGLYRIDPPRNPGRVYVRLEPTDLVYRWEDVVGA